MLIKEHIELIEKFYTAFNDGDAKTMTSCYHKELTFKDPAFGELDHDQACAMWTMLLERSDDLKIYFKNVWSENEFGGADWDAHYTFKKTDRKVLNKIDAKFEFKDGLIIGHRDHFNFYKWSRMALGAPGLFLGWSSFLHNKVKGQCEVLLSNYMSKK